MIGNNPNLLKSYTIMIKIDGNKIKKLREDQGLTQLYIATVVEVTTDTISRWENKRYPTIKQENGIKLAEALEVELSDILLSEEETDEDETQEPVKHNVFSIKKFAFPATLISLCLSALIFVGAIHFQKKLPIIQAYRKMPTGTIPGSPFPIVIQVDNPGSTPLSLILKESLPQDCVILQTSPSVGSSLKNGEIKWIQKINNTLRFSYLVKIIGEPGMRATFTGSVATSKKEKSPIKVSGADTVVLTTHHWSDINGDNRVSDQEILTVFDNYNDIDDFNIDIDLIERMWLGASYTWDQNKNLISITP